MLGLKLNYVNERDYTCHEYQKEISCDYIYEYQNEISCDYIYSNRDVQMFCGDLNLGLALLTLS